MATTSFTGSFGYLNYLNEINRPYLRDICLSYIKANGITTRVGKPHTEGSMLRRQKRVIDHLPAINWVQPNQAITPSTLQTFADYEEGVAMIRGNQQFDRAFLDDKNYVGGDPWPKQIQSYMEARSFSMDNYIINNSKVQGPIADVNGITGIKYRLAFPQATGSGCAAACNVQATADLSDAGISSTQGLKIARDIQRVLSHMGNPKGTGVIILLSPQCWWQLNLVIKNQGTAGGFKITVDAFDREVISFMDAELAMCGFQAPQDGGAQITPIIDDGQDVNGWSTGDALFNATGAVYTTMYFIQVGGKERFELWQHQEPWMIKQQITGTYNWIVLFEQSVGIWQPYTRSIARLYGVKTNGSAQD